MHRSLLRRLLVATSIVAAIVVNALANALPINGQNTGEISDRFSVYFVPAGYVFSIWGLIYLGLIAYGIYQALPAQADNPRLAAVDWLVVLSSLANLTWIFLWHYEQFLLSVLVIFVLLASLIAIYVRLGIGRTRVPAAERWLVRLVFSIYLGWVTVASIANVTSYLDYIGWDGFGLSDATWLIIMLAVALVVAGLMAWTRRDVAYLLVLVWAFIGIAVKFSDVQLVMISAIVATAVVALFVGASLFRRRTQEPPAPLVA